MFPQHLCGEKLAHYDKQLSHLLRLQLRKEQQYRSKLRAAGVVPRLGRGASAEELAESMWDAPFPLGEPHPIIALFSLAELHKIKLDIAYCANRHYCFSYLNGSSAPPYSNNPPGVGQHIKYYSKGGETYQIPHAIPLDAVELHTHSLAEVGGRRARAGQLCDNCGLWEDENAPESLCIRNETTNIAGITTGPGIGIGREVVGSLCMDCVAGMTCSACNRFFCSSCLYPDHNKPINSLATEDCGPQFLSVYCGQRIHGPHCMECLRTREDLFFQCVHCDSTMCLQCYPPSGVVADIDIYGHAVHDNSVGGRVMALAEDSISRFHAFHPRVRQKAQQDKKALARLNGEVLEEDELNCLTPAINIFTRFEVCKGCEQRVCAECLGYQTSDTAPGIRPTAQTEYIECLKCKGRFCGTCAAVFVKCECGSGICEACAHASLYGGIGELAGGTQCWGCWEVGGPSRGAHGYAWGQEADEGDEDDAFDPFAAQQHLQQA